MRVQDSAVVVTGASAGIGRETAALLSRQGARVWAVAHSEGPLEALAGECPNVVPVVADIADDDARAALVEKVGPVDVLVNNAWGGVGGDTADHHERAPIGARSKCDSLRFRQRSCRNEDSGALRL